MPHRGQAYVSRIRFLLMTNTTYVSFCPLFSYCSLFCVGGVLYQPFSCDLPLWLAYAYTAQVLGAKALLS